MTWAPDYCSLPELRSYLLGDQAATAGTQDDVMMQVAITAASTAINESCNRQFGNVGSPAARVYTPQHEKIDGLRAIRIDDLMDTTGLVVKTDILLNGTYTKTLVLGTDYSLWPYNAAANGNPWTYVVLRPLSSAYWPQVSQGVQITANWGWSGVPVIIKQACLLQAGRFFVRHDALFGVAGSPESGATVRLLARLDPDVALMLSSARRWWGAVAN